MEKIAKELLIHDKSFRRPREIDHKTLSCSGPSQIYMYRVNNGVLIQMNSLIFMVTDYVIVMAVLDLIKSVGVLACSAILGFLQLSNFRKLIPTAQMLD